MDTSRLVDQIYRNFTPRTLLLINCNLPGGCTPDPRIRTLFNSTAAQVERTLMDLKAICLLHNLLTVAWASATSPVIEATPDVLLKFRRTEDGILTYEVMRDNRGRRHLFDNNQLMAQVVLEVENAKKGGQNDQRDT